ncbi:MAG: hypothetical protein HYW89_03300 [Candidatus Sungiibacteriota bacterium]|uniref:Uncharacterized protein n=1 Tax=Candidatus Sungiibacteriota bacterium TaxID=2750080 RepID=A0A7T5UPM5_9BACT|nr:MAG: hypothetical protein HYW89_03300 [Candidatus Sungbacteria bacterium]
MACHVELHEDLPAPLCFARLASSVLSVLRDLPERRFDLKWSEILTLQAGQEFLEMVFEYMSGRRQLFHEPQEERDRILLAHRLVLKTLGAKEGDSADCGECERATVNYIDVLVSYSLRLYVAEVRIIREMEGFFWHVRQLALEEVSKDKVIERVQMESSGQHHC